MTTATQQTLSIWRLVRLSALARLADEVVDQHAS